MSSPLYKNLIPLRGIDFYIFRLVNKIHHAQNCKTPSSSMVGFRARDWIGLRPSRDSHEGLYKNLLAPLVLGFFHFVRLAKQALHALKTKKPSRFYREGFCARDWIPSILGFNIL
jgi:hypothetical protein